MHEPLTHHLQVYWEDYRDEHVPPETPRPQIEAQRLAFYSGVDAIVRLMARHLGHKEPIIYTQLDLRFLTEMAAEIAYALLIPSSQLGPRPPERQ